MKKHITNIVLVITTLLLLTTSVSAVSKTENVAFVDVPSDIWYTESVAWAAAQGIAYGTSPTTFSPDDTCTNAQVLTFIWRACGEPEPVIENPFDDVTEDKYYYKPALWAYACEMVTGSSFQAEKPCTRSMAVTYLWKEAGSPGVVQNSNFTDVSANSNDALAVAWAVEAGITDGTGNSTFSPATTCTRAHIITFLYRDFVGNSEGSGMDTDSLPIAIIPDSDSSSDIHTDTDYIEITP